MYGMVVPSNACDLPAPRAGSEPDYSPGKRLPVGLVFQIRSRACEDELVGSPRNEGSLATDTPPTRSHRSDPSFTPWFVAYSLIRYTCKGLENNSNRLG